MSESNHEIFVRTCCNTFQRLVDVYGFTGPVVEPLGRETFVRYLKGYREVSISYEPYASPLAASETGESPTPWAEKDGVPRSRRFPSLRVSERFKESDPASFARYLEASVSALETTEREFLESAGS